MAESADRAMVMKMTETPVYLADRLVDLQARLVGQTQVEQDDVRAGRYATAQAPPRRSGHHNAMGVGGERQVHLPGNQGRVIIDEQDISHEN